MKRFLNHAGKGETRQKGDGDRKESFAQKNTAIGKIVCARGRQAGRTRRKGSGKKGRKEIAEKVVRDGIDAKGQVALRFSRTA